MGAALQRQLQRPDYQLLGTGQAISGEGSHTASLSAGAAAAADGDERPGDQRIGTLVDKISTLPSEILGSVIEYACPDPRWKPIRGWCGSLLGGLLLVGCVNRSFLEALKYVSALAVDNLTVCPSARALIRNPIPFHSPFSRRTMDARFDGHVQRWCDIASRRLGGVLRMSSYSSSRVYGPDQTRSIVDCAASFPGLQELVIYDVDPLCFWQQLRMHLRAGRFNGLRRLVFQWNHNFDYFYLREAVKLAFRDLLKQLPVELAIELLLDSSGLYPRLLMNPGPEYFDRPGEEADIARLGQEEWGRTLFELVSRGADISSRPILHEALDVITKEIRLRTFTIGSWAPSDAQLGCLYETLEALIARGSDPLLCPEDRGCTVLHDVLGTLDNALDYTRGSEGRNRRCEPLFGFAMRLIDLLVRHGATSFSDAFIDEGLCQLERVAGADGVPFYRLSDDDTLPEYDPSRPLQDWIRARPDCTPSIRDALRRGNLMYVPYW